MVGPGVEVLVGGGETEAKVEVEVEVVATDFEGIEDGNVELIEGSRHSTRQLQILFRDN